MTNGNDDAFAWATMTSEGAATGASGLTKREYFAAMALSGILANYPDIIAGDNTVAVDAVRLADHLIDALNKGAA